MYLKSRDRELSDATCNLFEFNEDKEDEEDFGGRRWR